MAKLAVIGKIVMIEAIPGADRIKAATVVCGDAGRWVGVVGLGHHIGELVTVFLQDAILPIDARWSFMEKHHWRVRMSRFRGCPSECVIISGAPDLPIGTDLTEALGVTKHHKPLPESMSGEAIGHFDGGAFGAEVFDFGGENDLGAHGRGPQSGRAGTAFSRDCSRRLSSFPLCDRGMKGAPKVRWQLCRLPLSSGSRAFPGHAAGALRTETIIRALRTASCGSRPQP